MNTHADGYAPASLADQLRSMTVAELDAEVARIQAWIKEAKAELAWWKKLRPSLEKWQKARVQAPKTRARAPEPEPEPEPEPGPEPAPRSNGWSDSPRPAIPALADMAAKRRSRLTSTFKPFRGRGGTECFPCLVAPRNGKPTLRLLVAEHMVRYGPQRISELSDALGRELPHIQNILSKGMPLVFVRCEDSSGQWDVTEQARREYCHIKAAEAQAAEDAAKLDRIVAQEEEDETEEAEI